jgi:hypothetical protein
MTMKNLCWNRQTTPSRLHGLLEELGKFYPISEAGESNLEFVCQPNPKTVKVEENKGITRITYSELSHAARGLSMALSGIQDEEKIPFQNIGLMLDCSRNAVFKVDYLKKWLRQLALLGYNSVMLYLEDVYELPNEEYFGYQRGRYTANEIREIDDYADKLGISVIACIQTCGHMGQVLRWSAYERVADTAQVLLADNEDTYVLIEKMVSFFKNNLRSGIIHIGMDEAHDMGRGKFLDRFGSKDNFDIFEKHLKKVVDICTKYQLTPWIWSDMYFRMGSSKGDYYDLDATLPANLSEQVPQNVELVYWDYYHDNEQFYKNWIERHQQINGRNPVMCSGIWSWACPWYNREYTEQNAPPAIDAALENGISDMYFTLWNDNGAAVDFDSTLAGVAFCSEYIYSAGKIDNKKLRQRFKTVCGSSYEMMEKAAEINSEFTALGLLWDDPLLGIYRHNEELKNPGFWKERRQVYKNICEAIRAYALQNKDDNSFAHICKLNNFLALKLEFLDTLEPHGNMEIDIQALRAKLPEVLTAIKSLKVSFRELWLKRYKPFGLEVIQIRLAGQEERWREIGRLIEEFQAGNNEALPVFRNRAKEPLSSLSYRFNKVATASTIL